MMIDDIPFYLISGPHRDYQNFRCALLSDEALVEGMIKGLRAEACDLEDHSYVDEEWLSTDECCLFRYPPGNGHDHFNRTWFEEWVKENRPHILNQIQSIFKFKAFL